MAGEPRHHIIPNPQFMFDAALVNIGDRRSEPESAFKNETSL